MPGKSSQKGTIATVASKLAAGVQKHFASTTPILIAETSFSPAQLAAKLERLAFLRSEVEAAKAALKGKLEDEKREGPALRVLYFAVISFVRVAYEGAPEILADFGLAPRKTRRPLSGEEMVAAVAKRASTRAARGTIGKKEKAAIRGHVTGVVVTPVTRATEPPQKIA
jgi:hypothetical protein